MPDWPQTRSSSVDCGRLEMHVDSRSTGAVWVDYKLKLIWDDDVVCRRVCERICCERAKGFR